jgi:hypothetical protein
VPDKFDLSLQMIVEVMRVQEAEDAPSFGDYSS